MYGKIARIGLLLIISSLSCTISKSRFERKLNECQKKDRYFLLLSVIQSNNETTSRVSQKNKNDSIFEAILFLETEGKRSCEEGLES